MPILRKMHIAVGMVLGPFAVVTAITGTLILATGRFYNLLHWHAWFRWGGVALGLGLTFMFFSGVILRIRELRLRRKRRG